MVTISQFGKIFTQSTTSNLLLPTNIVKKQTETETETAPPATAPADTKAEPVAAEPVAAEPAPTEPSSSDLFSKLLIQLINSNKVQTAQNLISEIQNSTRPPESTESPDLSETLQKLIDSDNPSEAIEDLDQATLFALKQELKNSPLNEQSEKLINALFQHGPFVNYYIQSSLQERQVFDRFLKDMHPAAKEPIRNLEYFNTLNSFKDELSTTMRQFHEAKAKVSNLPARLQASTLRTAQIELANELAKLQGSFKEKIAKSDLEAITTTLSETRESTDNNPQAKNKLNEWTQKLFTAEGAVAATMLVPFLANILAGTLGDLPLVGGMIKSLAGLSSTIASSAQGLIQMLNTLNQTKTAQAVARLQGNSQTPKQEQPLNALAA